MSKTASIRRKLAELDAQCNALHIERNDLVIALTINPADRTVAKRRAELAPQIQAIEDEIAAYESALILAAAQDKNEKQAAGAMARRQSADRAVELCAQVAALNKEISAMRDALTEAEGRRDAVQAQCRAAALGVLRYSSVRLDIYTTCVGIVSDAVTGGAPAHLRWRLDTFLAAADQEDEVLA